MVRRRAGRIISFPMVVADPTRFFQLAALSDFAIFRDVVTALVLVLGVVLALHLLLDLFVLRKRRRAHVQVAGEHRLAAVAELSAALAQARDKESAARTILDTLNELVGFDLSGLVLINADGSEGKGFLGRAGGVDVSWYPSINLDLKNQASDVRRAFENGDLFMVENAPGSADIIAELITEAGLKSMVFLPLEGESGIIGVLTAGSVGESRPFGAEQLSLMRMLAAEGTLAIQRMDSVSALKRGLERECLVAEISRRVRAELDVDHLLDAALAETAKALNVERCFIRLGDPDGAAPLRAEWREEGLEPIKATETPRLAVSNLALRERKTAEVADVENDPRLADDSLGGREALLEIGSRAVLSAPIILFDSVIGALAAHASTVRRWSEDDVAFIEAIARELGIALHTAGLLEENRRQLEEQNALLAATEAMANELELDSVLAQRLAGGRAELLGPSSSQQVMDTAVRQAAALLDGEAALILQPEENELVVRALEGEGLEEMDGQRFPAAVSLAGDLVHSREPVVIGDLSQDKGSLSSLDPVLAHGFKALIGVPLIGPDDALSGVLFVYSRGARTWRVKEIEALITLAANSATALASAALYLRVSLEREQSLAILAGVADGIVAVDSTGRIVLWNAAAERITGIACGEALGHPVTEVLHHEMEAPEDSGDRSISIRRGSRELWLQLTEAVMRDPAGQTAGKIYMLRDVSADRFVEQAKSDFVSSVSHELRAPLTSIFGFAETLLRRGELFDDVQKKTFLSYIASESERLTGIVDALLDVAELDSGDLQVELKTTDVGKVVREVVESARTEIAAAQANEHKFVIDLSDEPLRAEADGEKLRSLLVNLIDNAIKFSPDGGTVSVTGQRRPGAIELRVSDEGVGIPVEERERIFRKFFRGSSSVLSGGTGLGLFITRGLVNAMGGRISVDSVEGGGLDLHTRAPLPGRDDGR